MKTAVLLATLDYPPARGGVASYLKNLAECFPPERMIVLAPEQGDTHALDVTAPFPVYRRRLLSRLVRPRWLLALYWTDWLVRKERPAHLLVSHLLPMGEVAWLMKKRHGLPYTVIVHGMDVGMALTGSSLKRERAKRVIAGAERIVANSAYTAHLVAALGAGPDKTMVVRPSPNFPLTVQPDAAAAASLRVEHGLAGRFVLLTVQRLVARKGAADVLKALAAMPVGERPAFVVAGDGPELDSLKKRVVELDLGADVVFVGAKDDKTVRDWFAACDAFVMVPKSLGADVEGFGIVYLEAGLFGKPVIGSRAGGVPDAVVNGETGLLVNPGHTVELVAAIRRLMEEPGLAARLGERGRKRVIEQYGWFRQARPLVEWLMGEDESPSTGSGQN